MSIAVVQGRSKVDSLVGMSEGIGEFVQQAVRDGTPLREFERDLFDRLLKMGHAASEQYLALQGNGDLGETVADNRQRTLYRSEKPMDRQLRTIFGEHEFAAYVYHAGHNPKTPIALRPVDERLGIEPDRYSPLLQEFSMLFSLEQAFEPAKAAFQTMFRQRLSVDTLEKISQRLGRQAGEFLHSLEVPPVSEEGELLVQTADGKGVPLVREDAAKLKSFEEQPQRPGNRRMATLACVYSVDRFVCTPDEIVAALFRDDQPPSQAPLKRPEPCHKRLIACFPQVVEDTGETEPISGATLALNWATQQVQQRRRKGQPLIRLMDGQHSLWDAADSLSDDEDEEQTVEILDIVHVASYVWKAAKVFHAHKEHQEAFARERLLRILQGNVNSVITGLRRRATRHGLRGQSRKEMETVCGYFQAHLNRMNYDEYLAAGYPIATGVIEGACRHLVKDRLERSGMRWTLDGAQAMLNLRALHQSGYWNDFHQQRSGPSPDPANTLTG